MNVLVLGGAGYIGAHTVLELLDSGHSVVVFDNFFTGVKSNIDKRADIFEGDILSKDDLSLVFKNSKFDAVMHFSALKAPNDSMINPEKYSEVNLIGTLNVLNQMLKSKVYNFIFSSSSSIYGEPINTSINEDHPLRPISYYGFTKLEIERILSWYSKLTDLNFVSLRYFNAAGYDLKSRIKVPEKNNFNLIPQIMEVIVGNKRELKIFGNNYKTRDGTCIRDYIHVSDISMAHVRSLDYLNSNDKSICLNLATGTGYTILEVIREIERQSGLNINHRFVERRKGDPSIVISSTKHNDSIFNWRPLSSDLKTIISSVLSIYQIKKVN